MKIVLLSLMLILSVQAFSANIKEARETIQDVQRFEKSGFLSAELEGKVKELQDEDSGLSVEEALRQLQVSAYQLVDDSHR